VREGDAHRSFLGLRLYTIVLILMDTEIRASELCTLTLENTDTRAGSLKVTGKGNKHRIVPISPTTPSAINDPMHLWRSQAVEDGVEELILSV
jgi:site-specific recombinase XerD